MPWVAISAADFVLEGFNSDERAKLQAAAGGDDGLTQILSAAIAEWRGIIQAAGNELDADTTLIPPSCRRHIISQVRWQVLVKFPSLKQLQTEERKDAADKAEEFLQRIAEGDQPIESPDDEPASTAGNWNANPKMPMRTEDGTRANDS